MFSKNIFQTLIYTKKFFTQMPNKQDLTLQYLASYKETKHFYNNK